MEAVIFSFVTTVVLIITFHIGRWFGIRLVVRRIEKELTAYEENSSSVDEDKG